MGWMVFLAQTDYQANWEKLDHLEQEAREVKWVFLVLQGHGVLLACIKERTCVLAPAQLVLLDILVSLA